MVCGEIGGALGFCFSNTQVYHINLLPQLLQRIDMVLIGSVLKSPMQQDFEGGGNLI